MANIPRELSKWAALLRPYKLNVWIPLIMAVILSGPVFWIISQQYSAYHHRPITFQYCYQTTCKIIARQGKLFCFKFTIQC